jgi:hypothetical protein
MKSELYSFDEAVGRLRKDPEHCSFAVFPQKRGNKYYKATMFMLTREDEDGEVYITLNTEGGLFFSSVGEEGSHDIDMLDEEIDEIKSMYEIDPRTLQYKSCTSDQIFSAMGMNTEFGVAILNGREEDAPSSSADLPGEWEAWLTQHAPTN